MLGCYKAGIVRQSQARQGLGLSKAFDPNQQPMRDQKYMM